MTAHYINGKERQPSIWLFPLWAIIVLLLTGCVNIPIKTELSTKFNSLGGGQHQMVLAVPTNYYNGDIFDTLPDFSLITGVSVVDYRQGDWQGMEVTQPFLRLKTLNDVPAEAHFLNGAFPNNPPLVYRTSWSSGFLRRDLRVQIFTNTVQSNALAETFALPSLNALNAEYVLEFPYTITSHNGELRNDRTVSWKFDATMPQVMEATARVMHWPMIVSLLFALGCGLLLIMALISGDTRGQPSKQNPQIISRKSRPERLAPPIRRRM